MNHYNHCTIEGNLTADPEIRQLKSTTVCMISVAINKSYKSNGDKKDAVSFIKVKLFGKLAEAMAKYLRKGSHVLVAGEISQDRWNDQSGKSQQSVGIVASTIRMLDKRRDDDKPHSQESRQEAQESSDDVPDDDIPF